MIGSVDPDRPLPAFLTSTLRASPAALGVIEGVADGLSCIAKLGGGALADDPERRRAVAVGGYVGTAVLSGLIGAASAAWQVGVLRAGAWVTRGVRGPARNALLASAVPASAYGRASGFERALDNLGAVGGPLLALVFPWAVGVRGRSRSRRFRGCSAFGLLAAVQSGGNLAASSVVGVLWTAASPRAAFLFAAGSMLVSLAVLAALLVVERRK